MRAVDLVRWAAREDVLVPELSEGASSVDWLHATRADETLHVLVTVERVVVVADTVDKAACVTYTLVREGDRDDDNNHNRPYIQSEKNRNNKLLIIPTMNMS